jgi:uncharacterized protein (UPF0147 family)
MNTPKLRIVSETREQRIERALKVMGEVMVDLSLPIAARKAVWRGYVALHACRSPEMVARLEQERGLR